MSTEILDMGLARLSEAIHGKDISPVEVLRAYLSRIDELNPLLNAYIHVDAEGSLELAHTREDQAQRGEWCGPLHGIPIAVKDNIAVAGQPMTSGSSFPPSRPSQDAPVVSRLRQCGAIFIGKTHLHEWAIGATSVNPHFGPARNPWEIERIPGGSSGGSAIAVAARLAPASLGTDTGGSIRIPAALCGVYGLRPTLGSLDMAGVVPVSWTFDTAGPITRDASDLALMLDALHADRREASDRLRADTTRDEGHALAYPLRIGQVIDLPFESDTVIRDAVKHGLAVLDDIGAEVDELRVDGWREAFEACNSMTLAEAAAFHRDRIKNDPGRFGQDVSARLLRGTKQSGSDYARARMFERVWAARIKEIFASGIDLIALPTTPLVAPRISDVDGVETTKLLTSFNYPFSLAGIPAVSIPCGFSAGGLPIGLQLAAAPGMDELLISVAHTFEAHTRWSERRPPL